MDWRTISTGTNYNIQYEILECRGQYLNRIKILGQLSQNERIPFFQMALRENKSENFFMLVDNRAGIENVLTIEDMAAIADLLVKSGIKRFYNAVVTPDEGYRGLVKLMAAIADTRQMISPQTIATDDYAEAEKFILSRMEKFMDPE